VYEFPGKCLPPSSGMKEAYGTLIRDSDLVAQKVVVTGTTYLRDQILVTSVLSEDVVTVGVVLDIIIRMDNLLFVVSLHEAIRTSFRYFQACPSNEIKLVEYKSLSDFKPLYKRNHSSNFIFFLHHHLPTPLN
jgi:hypothetical protein